MGRRLKLKTIILSTAVATMMSAAVVSAEPVTVTSEDGLVTLTLPDNNWVHAHDSTGTYFEQGQDGTWRNEQYGVYFYNHN